MIDPDNPVRLMPATPDDLVVYAIASDQSAASRAHTGAAMSATQRNRALQTISRQLLDMSGAPGADPTVLWELAAAAVERLEDVLDHRGATCLMIDVARIAQSLDMIHADLDNEFGQDDAEPGA